MRVAVVPILLLLSYGRHQLRVSFPLFLCLISFHLLYFSLFALLIGEGRITCILYILLFFLLRQIGVRSGELTLTHVYTSLCSSVQMHTYIGFAVHVGLFSPFLSVFNVSYFFFFLSLLPFPSNSF